MFKPDQPIKSRKEDILGRCQFAQSLGDAILSYKEKDSIVIGLFGEWGSGKTSIINMAIEHINLVSKDKSDKEKPIVVRFNPWNYSDQNQLITQFFRQLSVVLRRPDYASDAKKAGEKLETYAKFFKPLALIPTISIYMKTISETLESIGSATESWADLKSNDLDAIRTELYEILEKQPHKIIVVIDDIDRLSNTEIRQIFQLIKSLGDFPNTIYLLAFDKNVVTKAMENEQVGYGEKYLEKLVQIPREIPLISKHKVQRLLFSQLDELIKDIPENKWNQNYWRNIYHSGLKYFFNNIRDVTRYINSLRFGFGLVKGEVNVIDFFAITALQVFIPEVYYGIRDNKDVFAGVLKEYLYPDKKSAIEQEQKRYDEIIAKVDVNLQEVLKDFLKRLFPRFDNIQHGYDSLMEWRKDCRICSPDHFNIYFRLSLTEEEISQGEIETILSLCNNPKAFSEALLGLNDDRRITIFLQRFEDYTQDIPGEHIESVITVLMDIGDLFPEGDRGFSYINTPIRLLRLSRQLSHRLDSQEERFNIFKNAIERASRSLYTVVHEVSVQDQQHGKYDSEKTPKPQDELTVNAEQLEKLEKVACDKIEIWAEDGKLEKQDHLPYILSRWKEWGYQDKVNSFVSNIIKTDDGLINFITGFLNEIKSRGLSDYFEATHWQINLDWIKEFVDLKEIEPRVRKIFSSPDFEKLEDRKKLALERFLDTIDGKIKSPF